MATPLLELRDVRAAYGRIQVLHGIDLVVPERSVVALLGPNGAGKSTTLKIASGQMRPSSGCFHVAGRHVNGTAPEDLARSGLVAVPEGRAIFPNLTVRENLQMVTYVHVPLSQVEERTYERFPRLSERRSQMAGTLSGGEQQMLALARAVATDPTILILDEISMGLAPMIVAELYRLVADVARSGVAILLAEQFARTALSVADYAVVMAQGRVRAFGQPADVEEELSGAYLGGAA